MRHRQLGEALELLSPVNLVLALEDATGGRPGQLLMSAIDAGQQGDIGAGVLGGETPPPIARRAHDLFAQKLTDQASELGAAQAAELEQKAPQQSLDCARLISIVVAFEDRLDEGVLGLSRVELEVDGLASVEEALDLIEAERFGLLRGDSHRP